MGPDGPLLSLTYQHTNSEAYSLHGFFLQQTIDVMREPSSFNLGTTELSTELNRIFRTEDGNYIMPYMQLGAHYDYDRPGGGAILTSNLTTATPSAWSGWTRFGARATFSDQILVDAQGGYLSLGQADLSVWEAMLRLSIAL